MDELVSLIVPVYNVERYIEECISSILNQTYKNIEVILVDDGSTDRSGVLCDELAILDERISVIHKNNGGLSDARNTGIKYANGNYLSFVDSDDIIWNRYVEVLLNELQKNEADIAQGIYIEDRQRLGSTFGKTKLYKGKEAFKDYLLFGDITVSACAKLYKKSLFTSIEFPVGRINEDNLTMYKLLYISNKVVTVPYIIYYYRINTNSIMHGKYNIRRFEVTSVYAELEEYLGKELEKYINEVEYHTVRICYWVYNEAIIHSKPKEYMKQKTDLRDRIISIGTNNPYINKRYKLYYYLLKSTPSLYRWLVLMYRRKEIEK